MLKTTIKTLFLVLVMSIVMVDSWAVNLEEAPDDDVDDVDNAASGVSIGDIRVVNFTDTDGAPELDGVLDDEFWASAQLLSIDKELYPIRFAEAIVDTDVLAALSSTHLYLGITAYDPQPEMLRSSVRSRDGVKDGDYVSIVIDPTGNLRRKLEFRVNPHGSVSDVLQNTVSDRYIYDWDTQWRGAAKITSQGYVVEMEIPLNSIKQPVVREGQAPGWAVIFKRSYPRAVDRTFGAVYIFKKESGSAVTQTKRVELIPYYIFHPDEKRDKDEPFSQVKDHGNHDVGADIKLVVDSSTTVSATILPNYTDVEADIARDSINNAFTPFKPEKRKFFQEGRDLYSTTMPVVYTRNIVQPEVGLSFSHVGRRISAGGMLVSDESTELIMPDNLGSEIVNIIDFPGELLAARYATGEKGSSTGLITTIRTGDDYSNFVGGIDGLYNLGLDDKLRYQFMYSRTEYPDDFANDLCDGDDCLLPPPEDCPLGTCDYNAAVLRADPNQVLEGHGLKLAYKHDGPQSLYWLNYYDYGADYRTDFGFDKRTDYRQITAAYGRKWYFETLKRDKGSSRVRGYLVANHIESSEGQHIEDGFEVWGEFRGSFQTVFRAGYRIKDRVVNRIQQNTLELGDNAPLFDESYWQWYFEVSPVNYLTFNLDGRYGDIADSANLLLGEMVELKPKITVALDKFKLRLSRTLRDYDVDGSRLYEEDFLTLQLTYHPKERHYYRLLYLNDRTDRDTARFLAEEPSFETGESIEFTYLFTRESGLSILAGAKAYLENDSDLNGRYTSEREVYLKFVYNYSVDMFGNR